MQCLLAGCFQTQQRIMEIYTDGSCGQGIGPGGWSFVVLNGRTYVFGDFEGLERTSIGFLEAMAVFMAMSWCKKHQMEATIFCDSQYIVKAVNEWIPIWKANGWRKSNNKQVLNLELIQSIDLLLPEVGDFVKVMWVPGHSNNFGNNMAHDMANLAKNNIKKKKR